MQNYAKAESLKGRENFILVQFLFSWCLPMFLKCLPVNETT